MNLILLLLSLVMIACILCNKLTNKIGIPVLLAFLAVGMLCGVDGILHISFDNYAMTETLCTIALIFIIFYGGFGTKWSVARPVAGKAVLLSTLGVFLTAAAMGAFCHFALHTGWLEGMLVGAVLSSTDAASVFSILRSKKLNLKYGTASLLEVESGSNDPVAYLMTTILLAMMTSEITPGRMLYMVFAQIVYGVGIGALLAVCTVFFLRRFRFETSGFDTVFMLAVAILSYVLPVLIGGNGYLSAYIAGIILGNAKVPNKKNQVLFFDGVTSLMQLMVFFLLGLLCTPSRLPGVVLPALAIAVVLTFVARPLVVMLLLTPFRSKLPQQLLVSWAGLRGATSAIFALTAVASGVVLEHDLFHLVFCVVLFSIALQGTLLPLVSRKLQMIDASADVLKTFTDYTEEKELQLLRLPLESGNSWIGSAVSALTLPPDTLLATILRGDDNIVPRGDTVLCEGDVAVLAAGHCGEKLQNIQLSELTITPEHGWNGKTLAALKLPESELVILIRRGTETVIPQGDTQVLAGDVLVMYGNV